ncbi:MAG: oxygen-dependent coproporphyrinogen oxidase [Gammaproteobacteria bacterium]|nr:oxygen-dependent coproporphyrinogen oxidase [Gammaproteobacteria bacterium]
MSDIPNLDQVKAYLIDLQNELIAALEVADTRAKFIQQDYPTPIGGIARPRVLENGLYIEKAAVQFTHGRGNSLPPAATARNPELKGRPYEAASMSIIVHPLNPYAPTMHANLRFFLVQSKQPFWYFGGGFDLTPYYGFTEDAIHWHATAKKAADRHYDQFKQNCDEYFYITHRKEARGIGGIFFDDWTEGGFRESFKLIQSIGNAIPHAYLPILERRKNTKYSHRERSWQLYRRGRYVEFNLAIDRGTKYGLQSGRRIESVLASLPPLAAWKYDYSPAEGSPEEALLNDYLTPKNWLAQKK